MIFRDPWWSEPYSKQVGGELVAFRVVVGAVATSAAFAVPWAIAQLIGWVAEGFKPPANSN